MFLWSVNRPYTSQAVKFCRVDLSTKRFIHLTYITLDLKTLTTSLLSNSTLHSVPQKGQLTSSVPFRSSLGISFVNSSLHFQHSMVILFSDIQFSVGVTMSHVYSKPI